MDNEPKVKLSLAAGRVQAVVGDREPPIPVRIMYARPLTARTEIVLMDDSSEEIVTLAGLDRLDEESREVARVALRERYHLPKITQVVRATFQHGTRYFEVKTDGGSVTFAVREPGKNVSWLTPSHLIIRDTMGGPYEVPNLNALDARSRRLVRAML